MYCTECWSLEQITVSATAFNSSTALSIADRILVLENGLLVEQGNHQELLALQGKYSTLFNTQAKRYLEKQNNE